MQLKEIVLDPSVTTEPGTEWVLGTGPQGGSRDQIPEIELKSWRLVPEISVAGTSMQVFQDLGRTPQLVLYLADAQQLHLPVLKFSASQHLRLLSEPVLEVDLVAVTHQHQRQGLAGRFYQALIAAGKNISSSEIQSPGAAKMWANVSEKNSISCWARAWNHELQQLFWYPTVRKASVLAAQLGRQGWADVYADAPDLGQWELLLTAAGSALDSQIRRRLSTQAPWPGIKIHRF